MAKKYQMNRVLEQKYVESAKKFYTFYLEHILLKTQKLIAESIHEVTIAKIRFCFIHLPEI